MSFSDSMRTGMTRRDFVRTGAIAAAALACPTHAASPPRFIDVHHHFGPPGGNRSGWSAQSALEDMDRNGVATGIGCFAGAINSSSRDGKLPDRLMARSWNEAGARLQRDWPARFGTFATLPMLDTEGSLLEMAYAFDELAADGLGLMSNYGDVWLGDRRLDPIWEEANRRKAVVFVHPGNAPCCTADQLSYMTPPLSPPWLELPVNTARTILSLMVSGTLRKYRDIKFIFSHGGGVMPLLLGRIAGLANWDAVGRARMDELFPEGIHAEFARLRFECALAYAEVNFDALAKLVPPTHILFGTDYDRIPIEYSVTNFDRLSIDATTARLIARGNAETLFPRLRALPA